jgi:hypothetical protein
MSFKEKYLKYKAKYIALKNGGYIKGDIKIEQKVYSPEIKSILDAQMPLCFFNNEQKNFLLINDENYILINKKDTLKEDYELYKFNKNFDIIKIENKNTIIPIEDNIRIPGLNTMIDGINLIQAFNYHNTHIFYNFFNKVWNTEYYYLNRLKNMIFTKVKGEGNIIYQKKLDK